MSKLIAAHFLAGSVLTLAMPLGLLIIIGVYWTLLIRRRSTSSRTGKPK